MAQIVTFLLIIGRVVGMDVSISADGEVHGIVRRNNVRAELVVEPESKPEEDCDDDSTGSQMTTEPTTEPTMFKKGGATIPVPTSVPTPEPTETPTPVLTPAPTSAPTLKSAVTQAPTNLPTPSPTQPAKLCKGSTSGDATKWQAFGCGVFVDVNTSSCGFTSTPRYFTSLGGNTHHWMTTGVSSLYDESPSGFRVYITQKDCTPLQDALNYKWHVNWVAQSIDFGADGSCISGSTPAGSTNWAKFGDNVVVDVDTSGCHFKTTPLYFTSMGGSWDHWTTTGATSIYSPTASRLQVYISQPGGVTTSSANQKKWHIRSLAIPTGAKGDSCAGSTPQGHTNWQAFYDLGIFVDVDIKSCGFSNTPLFFTSIGGTTRHWETTGATSIYQPTKDGFRVYVREISGHATTPSEANGMGWHINWVAMK